MRRCWTFGAFLCLGLSGVAFGVGVAVAVGVGVAVGVAMTASAAPALATATLILVPLGWVPRGVASVSSSAAVPRFTATLLPSDSR